MIGSTAAPWASIISITPCMIHKQECNILERNHTWLNSRKKYICHIGVCISQHALMALLGGHSTAEIMCVANTIKKEWQIEVQIQIVDIHLHETQACASQPSEGSSH